MQLTGTFSLIVLTIALLTHFSASAQDCSYDPDVHGQLEIDPTQWDLTQRGGSGITYVGVKFNIVEGAFSTTVPHSDHLKKANEAFLPYNIQFVHCGDYIYRTNDSIWKYNPANQWLVMDQHELPGLINIFIPGQGTIVQAVGGNTAYAVPDQDRIIIPGSMMSWSLLAHELGHILGLDHTHHTQYGAELVDGSNCTTAGDRICDTPADPNLGQSGMLDSACNYIGTVTDSNGALYNPQPENLMSYASRKCRNLFTPGQGQWMNNVLENEKWYLNRYNNDRSMDMSSFEVCQFDSTYYLLSGSPTGGSFSGNGVQNGTFYAPDAGTGIHTITYAPPYTDSVDLTQQYWIREDAVNGYDTLTTAWQTVRFENDGRLLQIRHRMKLEQPVTLTLDIFQGAGTGSSLLHSQTYSLSATTGFEWQQLDIDGLVPTAVDDTLTYRLSTPQPMILEIATQYPYGFYPDGGSNWGADTTHHFAAFVRAAQPCGSNIYGYVQVHDAIEGDILQLNPSYCASADTIDLKAEPGDGVFLVNGDTTNSFVAGAWGTGTHSVTYHRTDIRGCYSAVERLVEVELLPVDITGLAANYCLNNTPQLLSGTPAGGALWVNGLPTDTLDPAALGEGTFDASYSYREITDTNYLLDQWNAHVPGEQLWPIPDMVDDSAYWQSFVPQVTGILDRIELPAYTWEEDSFFVALYKGEGTNGQLLFTDTVYIDSAGFYEMTPLIIPDSDLMVYKDSLYSWSFQCPTATVFPQVRIIAGENNGYPAGTSVLDSAGTDQIDFYFEEYIREYRYCRDTATLQFTIEDCTVGTGDEPATSLQVYPNPSAGMVNITSNLTIDAVKVYATSGQLLYNEQPSTKTLSINELAAGYYIIEVVQGDNIARHPVVVY